MPEVVGNVVALRAGKEATDQEVMELIAAERGISVDELERAVCRWAVQVLERAAPPTGKAAVLSLVKA